jgi:hypothetical protein
VHARAERLQARERGRERIISRNASEGGVRVE